MLIAPISADGPSVDAEAHVQQVLGRLQVHRRQFHLGEGVTGLADRRQQSLLRRQHIGGHRRRTRRQAELIACRRRHIALDRHTPQVEQRSRIERGHHRDRRVGRCLLQQVGQIGLVERLAGHRHSHLRGVIAEAVQRGLEAAGVIPGPGHQGERARRRLFPQRLELRGVAQCLIQRGVAGRRERHRIGLRIGAQRRAANQQERGDGQQEEYAVHCHHGSR